MKVWILGGTTEGRELLALGLPSVYTVATEYGAEIAQAGPNADVRVGRLNMKAMCELLRSEPIVCVLDATHPYAAEASKNAREAAGRCAVPYVRVLRCGTEAANVMAVENVAAAAAYLADKPGNVLLATGSKEIEPFMTPGLRGRIYVRVLPTADVMARCAALGIDSHHIIAMQGPFGKELNIAMLRRVEAKYLVTKDGGVEGGMQEKLDAARETGAEVVLISRPEEHGVPLNEAVIIAKRLLIGEEAPRFPLWADIRGRLAVVVGGGVVAQRRIGTLLRCGASVKVICPEELSIDGVAHVHRQYEPGDLAGAFLAVAATNDGRVNAAVTAEAKGQGIWVSDADDGENGTFHFPSLVNEGAVAVSVSSAGISPALTKKLSGRLRTLWSAWVKEEGD
jgi:precorrin-6A/cobalt-precorrin-6A reductase